MLLEQIVGAVSGKGRLAPDQLIEHTAKAVQVGPRVEPFAPNLLGRHIAARAANFVPQKRKKTREPARALLLGNRKVDELDLSLFVNEKVVGLHVAVDPGLRVQVVQRLGALLDDA